MKNLAYASVLFRSVKVGRALLLSSSILGTVGAFQVQAAELDRSSLTFNIPAQHLDNALMAYAEQAKIQIQVRAAALYGLTTDGVSGEENAEEALTHLLRNSGLHYRLTAPHTIALVRDEQSVPPAGSGRAAAESNAAPVQPQLEEVVVTAQKRSQDLQKVPLTVSAFNAGSLRAAGITDVRDLQQEDSSLSLSFSAGVPLAFMRGVGNPGAALGNDASVPIYIDDVYYTRVAEPYLDLGNIERVEVLKGPQGTLFGRNSSGGLINVFTREPNRDRAVMEATVGYGNYDTSTGKLYASTPLGDKVAADISVSALDQNKGWGKNLYTGQDTYRRHFVSGRSKVVATLSDDTKLTLIGFYVNSRSEMGLPNARVYGAIGATPAFYGPPQPIRQENIGFYNVNQNFVPYVAHEGYGGSLKIEHALNFADFVSITAYRHGDELYFATGERSPFPFLGYTIPPKDKQTSQEFQLKSKKDSSFDWIVGAYYLNSVAAYDPGIRVFGDAFGLGSSGPDLSHPTLTVYQDIHSKETINSYAGYGQATFHVIPDGTNVTLGLRYTIDDLHGVGTQTITRVGVGTFPAGPSFDGGQEFRKLTYKVAVDHTFADGVMGFVSVSRGYKAGNFNMVPLIAPPTRPEVLDSYEIGLKTEFFEKRVRLNLSVFQNDIKDPEVQVVQHINNVDTIFLTNAGAARSKGIDLAGSALVAEGLTLRFGASYLDAKYLSFQNAPFQIQRFAPPYGNLQVAGDASGNYLTQSPKFKGNIGANYDLQTASGTFNFDIGVVYTGKFYWAPDNFYVNKPYALVNAAISYQPAFNDRLGVRIWGKNLTDQRYYSNARASQGGQATTAVPGAPLTFGVEVSYKY